MRRHDEALGLDTLRGVRRCEVPVDVQLGHAGGDQALAREPVYPADLVVERGVVWDVDWIFKAPFGRIRAQTSVDVEVRQWNGREQAMDPA